MYQKESFCICTAKAFWNPRYCQSFFFTVKTTGSTDGLLHP
ncbi:hypothetical protein CLOSTMETH_01631 [[Clostridium] methylpentosum DSM 5476]|uniref:Uncharacterized protein n=1 Tax=[Clostridium] methylpentosum DSM 5476 TaxID=537013 RepID=C0ECR0_9FIRM|nr:hypothetical protein CLOSTMETH_01631 [[Clostridium] methylpentosum DSM 5476]